MPPPSRTVEKLDETSQHILRSSRHHLLTVDGPMAEKRHESWIRNLAMTTLARISRAPCSELGCAPSPAGQAGVGPGSRPQAARFDIRGSAFSSASVSPVMQIHSFVRRLFPCLLRPFDHVLPLDTHVLPGGTIARQTGVCYSSWMMKCQVGISTRSNSRIE